jgi:hypothetical protein
MIGNKNLNISLLLIIFVSYLTKIYETNIFRNIVFSFSSLGWVILTLRPDWDKYNIKNKNIYKILPFSSIYIIIKNNIDKIKYLENDIIKKLLETDLSEKILNYNLVKYCKLLFNNQIIINKLDWGLKKKMIKYIPDIFYEINNFDKLEYVKEYPENIDKLDNEDLIKKILVGNVKYLNRIKVNKFDRIFMDDEFVESLDIGEICRYRYLVRIFVDRYRFVSEKCRKYIVRVFGGYLINRIVVSE